MKNDYDITKQYQDDLIKAYNKVAPTCWTQEEAYRRAVKQPAPRYYVSPKQAAQVIAPMVRGDFERVNLMMPNRKRMYYSLFKRVIELSEKRDFIGKSLTYIMQFAVISPAPEFFVSHHAIAFVRTMIKNGYMADDGRSIAPWKEKRYAKLKARRAMLKEYRAQFKNSPQ